MNGLQIKRWFFAMIFVMGYSIVGCGGGDDPGDENTTPTDVIEDETDTTAPPVDTVDDTQVISMDPCPGLLNPETCEEVEAGGDNKGAFSMPCFDQDNDRYPDDAGENPIYVDSSFHWFGEGDGSLTSPFISLSAAMDVAGPNATIILARSDADTEIDGSYEAGLDLDAADGIQILGIGECDGDTSTIKHTGNAPAIAISNSANVLIQGLTLSSSDAPAIVLTGNANGTIIHQNRFKDVAGDVISVVADDTTELVIRDNEITKTLLPGCGIRIEGGTGSTVEQNIIERILGAGICISDTEKALVENNRISENQGGGIAFSNVDGEILRNDLEENQVAAIGIAGEGHVAVYLNAIEDNEDSGIVVSSTGSVNLYNNQIEGHAQYGVVATDPNADLTIHHNDIGRGDGVGVALFSDTDGIPAAAAPSNMEGVPGIYENEISDVRGAGIYLDGVSGAALIHNNIDEIESDGGHLGDGVAARNSAVLVLQGVISGCERFGVAFGDSKGDVREVLFENVSANVACKANTCANISYTDTLPEIIEDPVPENYEPIGADEIIP